MRQAERALRCAPARRPTAPLPPCTAAWAGRSTGRDPSPPAPGALWKANRPRSNSERGHRRAVDQHVLLVQVPAARPHHQHGLVGCLLQHVVLAAVRRHPVERAGDRLAQGALAGRAGWPRSATSSPRSRPCSTFAPEFSALITIFGFDRPGDLDAAVEQGGGQRGHPPVAGADGAGVLRGSRAARRRRSGRPGDAPRDQAGLAGRPRSGGAGRPGRSARPASAGLPDPGWPGPRSTRTGAWLVHRLSLVALAA